MRRLVGLILSLLVSGGLSAPAVTATPTSDRAPGARAPAAPNVASAIVAGRVNRTSLFLPATYDVRASLNFASARLSVISYMVVTNRSGGGVDRLELNTVAARLGAMTDLEATVDGRAVSPTVSDQTIRVPLGGVLPDDGSASVRIAFRARFRIGVAGHNYLFAKHNSTINAYRWIPWISRATPFDRPNFGDPFVTPASRSVRVAIRTDQPMPIATSGRRVAVDGLTQTFLATNVRDFNFTASPLYRRLYGMVGQTRITVFHLPGGPGQALLDETKASLYRLNALVGQYPHPTYTVAQSAGGYALESPGHVWLPPVESWRVPYLVRHETAHQWFYGIVGNDQAREPFADEAMADFLTRYTLGSFRQSACSSSRLDLTIYDYSSACYYELVYVKGANVLNDARRRMGSEAFWSAVRAYTQAYEGKLSHTGTLLRFLDSRTGVNLSTLFRTYFPSLY